MSLPYFEFNGRSSAEFGVVITSATPYDSANRDIEIVNISGYNSEYIQTKNRYSNVLVSYECAIIPKPYIWNSISEQINAINLWLHSGDDSYCILCDSYNTETYRMAYLDGSISYKKNGLIYHFSVNFKCEPYKYGLDTKQDISQIVTGNNFVITNNNAVCGLPLIEVKPYSDTVGMFFVLNSTRWFIASNGTVVIDSKKGKVFDQDGNFVFYHNGTAENFVAPINMPLLKNGKNILSIDEPSTSNIYHIDFKPRWCYL